jgi:hypothetical protein
VAFIGLGIHNLLMVTIFVTYTPLAPFPNLFLTQLFVPDGRE